MRDFSNLSMLMYLSYFPISMIIIFVLKNSISYLRVMLYLVFPILFGLLYLNVPNLPYYSYYFALFTTIFYYFRLIGEKSLYNWLNYYFIGTLNLIYFIENKKYALVFVLFLAVLSAVMFYLFNFIDENYGTTEREEVLGLFSKSKGLSFLIIISVILAIGIPPSILFEFLMIQRNILYLTFLLLAFLLLTFGGLKIFEEYVFGKPSDDILYVDLPRYIVYFLSVILVIFSFIFIAFLEVVNYG